MKYKNPIIPGFNPDPSICRVGEDFYLVTSTFEFFPGVPVYHSKNLVNWELINYCLTTDSQLPLEGQHKDDGKGTGGTVEIRTKRPPAGGLLFIGLNN